MSALQINGTTYDGSPASTAHPFPPSKIDRVDTKIGKTLIADSGKRNFITRSVVKPAWTLSWANANVTTRTAVLALSALNTTFTFVDQFGTSWTVQCEEDDAYTESPSFTTSSGALLYDLKLTFHIAT